MLALIAAPRRRCPDLDAALGAIARIAACAHTPKKTGRLCAPVSPAAPCRWRVAGGVCRSGRSRILPKSRRSLRACLKAEDELPADAALAVADGIRHLLVDEFQDTSRRQHSCLRAGRRVARARTAAPAFVVGDPMQSIYFFRDADAELFPRVRDARPGDSGSRPHSLFDFVPLKANFRTAPALVERLNEVFRQDLCVDDGSGISFPRSQPVSEGGDCRGADLKLHLEFVAASTVNETAEPDAAA